jgi:Protein of unknown function (DUF3606)
MSAVARTTQKRRSNMASLTNERDIESLAERLGCTSAQVCRAIELVGTNEELVRHYLYRLGYVAEERTRSAGVGNLRDE